MFHPRFRHEVLCANGVVSFGAHARTWKSLFGRNAAWLSQSRSLLSLARHQLMNVRSWSIRPNAIFLMFVLEEVGVKTVQLQFDTFAQHVQALGCIKIASRS